jgi:hypothetical protein
MIFYRTKTDSSLSIKQNTYNKIFDSYKSNKLSINKRIIIKDAVENLIDVLSNESWD